MTGIIHTREGISKLREVGRIIQEVHKVLKEEAIEGITTKRLNKIADEIIYSFKAEPAFLGYRGYPFSICTSVNEYILHGFPSEYRLQNKDIISIDVGVKKDGYFGDACFTKIIGAKEKATESILTATKDCLYNGISLVKNNVKISNIGRIIEDTANKNNFNILKEFGGHFIGKNLHENFIPNYETNTPVVLKTGMCLCIEPILTTSCSTLKERWEIVGKKGSISCHCEHQIVVHDDYGEIIC